MVTTGPVGMPLDQEQSGLRAVAVRAEGITHVYYTLGTLPNRLGH